MKKIRAWLKMYYDKIVLNNIYTGRKMILNKAEIYA